MFKKIEALMGEGTVSVSLIVAKDKDGLTVTVLPKTKEGADAALSTPLVLKGTADEMDAEFANLLEGYTAQRKSLAEQLADTVAVIDAAKKASAGKAQDALKKGAKATAATKPATVQGCDSVACGGESEEDEETETAPVVAATPVPAQAPAANNLFAD